MKLKTLIKKLENQREAFLKKHGKEPVIFSASLDWDETLEVTITSKVTRDGCISATDAKETEDFKVKI